MLSLVIDAAIGTCPHIMFTVHFLSQHLITPGEEHLNTIKHVYHYLIGTQYLGLVFHSNQFNMNLVGYSDSDWARDPNSQRSVSRYTFILCRAAIPWSAKKQPTLPL